MVTKERELLPAPLPEGLPAPSGLRRDGERYDANRLLQIICQPRYLGALERLALRQGDGDLLQCIAAVRSSDAPPADEMGYHGDTRETIAPPSHVSRIITPREPESLVVFFDED